MKFTSWVYVCGGVMLSARLGHAAPALTIYNQNFAVVRDTLPLDLKEGDNAVQVTDTTALVEPDSVVLRDPTGQRNLQILEQNYRADPVTEERLLTLYEGKTIDFLVTEGDHTVIVPGKIIRSGNPVYSGPRGNNYNGYGYNAYNSAYISGAPIIEVDGKLRFALPGTPLFPALPSDTILKPTLNWLLRADKAGPLNAEVSYVTGGMSWKADYNLVSPENGDDLQMVGWVTFSNQSGKTFENAQIKLMAGDVNKIQPQNGEYGPQGVSGADGIVEGLQQGQVVTQKTFDEYHLYTIARPATLRDRESKQVEFTRADKIKSQRIYLYDGAKIDWNQYEQYVQYNNGNLRQDRTYGTQSNPKIWVMREFKNTLANGLGIPLPKGRMRFYRRDSDGQLEFTGENTIDHTPENETLRMYLGDAFDVVGERKQTAYKLDEQRNSWADESFEIKLRNHKKEAVEVRVVEHLYRGLNWEITAKSDPVLKTDSKTVEFRVQVPPEAEKTVTYTVHYSW